MARRLKATDIRLFRHPRERRDLGPARATVASHVHEAVVGADIERVLVHRRLAQRHTIAVDRRRRVLRNGIHILHAPHDLELVAIDTARQVATDGRPRVAAVVAAKQPIAGEVEARRTVRTDQQRRIPVPHDRWLLGSLSRLDVGVLAALAVVPHQPTVLPLRVDKVRIGRVDHRLVTIAADRHKPVFVGDAGATGRARRTAHRVVVLRAAVDVVEGLRLVSADSVELRERQVLFEVPVGTAVPRVKQATIATNQQVVWIARINPQRMVIDVAMLVADVAPRLAAIARTRRVGIEAIDSVFVVRVTKQFVVVLRARRDLVADLAPALAAIERTERAALAALRFDNRVEHVGVRRRNRHADAPHVDAWQALADLAPGRTTIGGLVDR